ncbi:MAG: transketolase C-terminal domain-containing protein [Thermocladium sp.]|jgi:transketolase
MVDVDGGNAYKYGIERGLDAIGISIIAGEIKKISLESRKSLMEMSRRDSIHLGSSLSSLEIIASLYYVGKVINGGDWVILSKGHAAPALYAVLAELGLLSRDELPTIQDIHSRLQGHPEVPTPGVDASTGSLGQGLGYAIGLATALKLSGKPNNVLVLVGDGELDEGQAWEALMDAVNRGLDNLLIVIDANGFQLDGPVRPIKERAFKAMEALGLEVAQVNGHDVDQLVREIIRLLGVRGRPKAIIARTIHGNGCPEIENTSLQRPSQSPRPSASMRDSLGKSLVRAMDELSDLVVLTADVGGPTRASMVAKNHGSRYIDVGISEQELVSVAAGLAGAGMRPAAVAFAMFLMRAWEQARNTVARMNLNVKLIGTHAGYSDISDGSSHQVLEDIALMRVLPNFSIVVPADAADVERSLPAALRHDGPLYYRVGRDYSPSITDGLNYEFKLGRGVVLEDGSDIAIIGAGPILWDAIMAVKELGKRGVSVSVINMASVKPLDEDLILKYAKKTGAVITVEEHMAQGGLGSSVAELLSTRYAVPIRVIGAHGFGRSARSVRDLLMRFGVNYRSIINAAMDLLNAR